MEYNIRLMEREDVEDILRIYSGTAGITHDRASFDWQYIRNPARRGTEPMIVAEAIDSKEIVGFILSTPWKLRWGEKTYHATIGSDAFVNPNCRKRGLYNRMAEFLLSQEAEALEDVRIVFYNVNIKNASTSSTDGFETSVSLHLSNPRRVVEALYKNKAGRAMSSLYSALQHAKTARRSNENVKLRQTNIGSIHEKYEKWRQHSGLIHTDRSIEYLRWRFLEDPTKRHDLHTVIHNGKEAGYVVSSVSEAFGEYALRTAIISDYIIMSDDPDVFEAAIRQIVEKCDDVDVVMARAFATPHYQERLKRMGFLESLRFPLNHWIRPGFFALRMYNQDFRQAAGRDKWYLTQSDCF
jgi:L-amino acid N-acyltransferase YncA/ribosomal protein S18 acetylase RimI-like enzyme